MHIWVTETRLSGKVKVTGSWKTVIIIIQYNIIRSEIIMNWIIVLLSNNRSKFDKLMKDLSRIWNADTKKEILAELSISDQP